MKPHAENAVRFATLADAADIAALSRDAIEYGLPWSWTEPRVARAIENTETNVVVVGDPGLVVGFGMMSYPNDDAHLLLFAVRRQSRRQGIGTRILAWLEEVAMTAGVRRVRVECRRDNAAARNFYAESGYHETSISPKYYRGLEDAIRLEKWLVPST